MVPEGFARIVAEVRAGGAPLVRVSDLVDWFGFTRRGARVNSYIRSVMQQERVTCTPSLEAALLEEPLRFSSVTPIIVQAPIATPPREHPHPIAVFAAAIRSQSDLTRRVTSRLDALERAVSYLAFAELAALRARENPRVRDALRALLEAHLPEGNRAGPPLTFGSWVEVARRLADHLVDDSPIALAARAFAQPRAGQPALGARISNEVVSARNAFKHGTLVAERAYLEAEARLEAINTELLDTLRPLLDCDLVSVRAMRPGEHEAYAYEVRDLRGAGPFFPCRTLETSQRLTGSWAWLVLPQGPLLRLAPGVLCVEDRANEMVTVFLARTLALEPGQRVKTQAVIGAESRDEPLPT